VGHRIVAVILVGTLLIAAQPAQAGKGAGFKQAVRREWASFRSIFRSPARSARFVASSAAAIGAGFVIKQLTASPAEAAFGAYVAGTVVDRVIDRFSPRTRPIGWKRPPLLRDVIQVGVGATVAAVASPLALDAVQPLAQLGDSAPGVIGLAARLMPSRQILQMATGGAVSMVANGANAAVGFLFPAHKRRRAQRLARLAETN
jgi:hypothetical protein